MEKLLIVEDSRSSAIMIREVLSQLYSFDIDTANSLKEFQKLTSDPQNQYFLALLDLNLPDAPDGEIVDLAIDKNIPSIVYTANVNKKQRTNIWEKGVIDYILKTGPQSISYICEIVGRIYKNREMKVLVVDDHPAFRQYIEQLLSTHQFQVFKATDGKQALDIFKSISGIKLIITDNEMPELGGIDLTIEIRKLANIEEVSIIGISAFHKADVSANFLKNGANDFIYKPFSEEEFYCRINQNLKMQESIEVQKKLNQEKNRLLSMASHDVKSPLSGIYNLCQMIIDDPDSNDNMDLLKVILEAAEQITEIVDNLLDVSVVESNQFRIEKESIDIINIIHQRIKLMEVIAAKKSIKITFNFPDKLILEFDRPKISQVIDNLLSNAIKYSEPNTTIFVNADKNKDIKISVKDQGQGISEDNIQNLFKMYTTAGSIPTGGEKSTGIGLAIVKKIIDAHGGSVGVKSEPGIGSEFNFTLPI